MAKIAVRCDVCAPFFGAFGLFNELHTLGNTPVAAARVAERWR